MALAVPSRALPSVTSRGKARVAALHKWLGLILTVPLLGWMVSAAAMMLTTMNAPNGLAGSYTLRAHNSVDIPLDGAALTPTALLDRVRREHGLTRVFWVRLQSRGPHLWYVVKPTPYAEVMVYDARSGARLDPLPDSLLAVVAGEALDGSAVTRVEPTTEYNRYYQADRLDAVRAHVAGAQPATLILSRDEGRTLRRLNAASGRFEWWYRMFHVNQYSNHLALWTTLLYAAAAGVIVLSLLGYFLFVWRGRRQALLATAGASSSFAARNLHRKVGAVVGGILIVQLGIGIYLWLCLGPLEDPFRGKASFNLAWQGGFPTTTPLADPGTVLRQVTPALSDSAPLAHPVQSIEWRRLGDRDAWLVSPRKDQPARVFAANGGAALDSLSPSAALAIAREEVVGRPEARFVGAAPQLWMDLNRPVPTYRFRFADPHMSDIYVAQATGEVIQRRPEFWRYFDPFLAVHMFEFTNVKAVDMTLLFTFQLAVLVAIVSGWRLQFPGAKRAGSRERRERHERASGTRPTARPLAEPLSERAR